MSDNKNLDELIDDPSEVDDFIDELEENGLVVSSVDDGIVIGISADKLRELLEKAMSTEDELVLLFVKKRSTSDAVSDLKN